MTNTILFYYKNSIYKKIIWVYSYINIFNFFPFIKLFSKLFCQCSDCGRFKAKNLRGKWTMYAFGSKPVCSRQNRGGKRGAVQPVWFSHVEFSWPACDGPLFIVLPACLLKVKVGIESNPLVAFQQILKLLFASMRPIRTRISIA